MDVLSYRPSAAQRRIACIASAQAEFGRPNTSSDAANLGTSAHKLAEICLNNDSEPYDYIGDILEGQEVTDNMAEAIVTYLKGIHKQTNEDTTLYVEINTPIDCIADGVSGTVDCAVIDWGKKHATVNDYKHGQGVEVSAIENEQMLSYAAGLRDHFAHIGEIETFTLAIHQPRKGNFSTWDCTGADIDDFIEVARQAIAESKTKNPSFTTGEKQCQFCLAKADCKALADEMMETYEMNHIGNLPVEEMANILPKVRLMTNWLKAVEGRALEEALDGKAISGFKLVESRTIRKWSDTEKAARYLSQLLDDEDCFTSKIISPTQAEKILGKQATADMPDDLVIKPQGRPTLVSASDKRKELDIAQSLGFSDITK